MVLFKTSVSEYLTTSSACELNGAENEEDKFNPDIEILDRRNNFPERLHFSIQKR